MELYGRSSSHFTRIARIFAHECEVPVEMHLIRDLMSVDPADYGDNPALKMPTLVADDGERWFGSIAICRELVRNSELNLDVTWPEDLDTALGANAQEMVLQAMSTEVGIVLGKSTGVPADNAHQLKLRASLLGNLRWLEDNVANALAQLPPERDLSYLEVSLFCLVEHLPFRDVMTLEDYPSLRAFGERFARRSSAKATTFKFDFQ
jgi:glutathione S-transferase